MSERLIRINPNDWVDFCNKAGYTFDTEIIKINGIYFVKDGEIVSLFHQVQYTTFGDIKIEHWPGGLVLWVGGEIRWKSWGVK